MATVHEALTLALARQQRGDLIQAERIYQQVLAVRPTQPDALHLLGMLKYEAGQLQTALGYVEQAVQVRPDHAPYSNSLGILLVAAGRHKEALAWFERALQLKPDYADAHSNLGRLHHEQGHFQEAVASCRRALEIEPSHADALYNLGNSLCAVKEWDAAVAAYQQAITLRPAFANAHNNLAGALLALGRAEEAIAHYRQAVAIRPAFAEAYANLGRVCQERGLLDEAIAAFRHALQRTPSDAGTCNRLGVALHAQGRLDEAAACFRQATAMDPQFAEAHNNLGTALLAQGNAAEAIASYQRAIQIKPVWAEAHCSLGSAYKALEMLDQSVVCYQRALELRPDYPQAHNNLGNTLKAMGRTDEAVACYRRALEGGPDDLLTVENLAGTYKEMELLEEAAREYRRASALRPGNPLADLRIDALCPAVFPGNGEIDAYRRSLDAALDRYLGMEVRLPAVEVAGMGCEPSFNLTFQGRDERPLKEKYAAVFRHCFPAEGPPPGTGIPRIGMVVTKRHEGVFLRDLGGIAERLDPKRLAVTIVCAESGLAKIRARLSPHVACLPLPDDFAKAVERIREARFDLLDYWEVGTDAYNYFLPFMRLAPVQCLTLGTQCTTGIPAMDYHVSSRLVELPEADRHYSERLVRLTTLPTYRHRLDEVRPLKPRESFGLSDSRHVYLCAQNVRKFHPDFDAVLAAILRGDPEGILVVLRAEHDHLTAQLQHRFSRAMPDVADRIEFLPRMPRAEYLNLMAVCDVLLDPLYYGGVNTTYDAFALGKPLVTWPTLFQHGRYTAGCYRKMEVLDCVASSADDYAQIAVRLGRQRDYREEVAKRIHQSVDVLFEDTGAVLEYQQFFEQAVDAARQGTRL